MTARLAGFAGGYLGVVLFRRARGKAARRAADREQLADSYEAWIAGLTHGGGRDCSAAEQSPPRNRRGR